VGVLARIALRREFKRLVAAGIAPPVEQPLDFDTEASPGDRQGARVLLLTDGSLYASHIGSASHARRYPLDELGHVLVEDVAYVRHATSYRIFDRAGELIIDTVIHYARPSFRRLMEELGRADDL